MAVVVEFNLQVQPFVIGTGRATKLARVQFVALPPSSEPEVDGGSTAKAATTEKKKPVQWDEADEAKNAAPVAAGAAAGAGGGAGAEKKSNGALLLDVIDDTVTKLARLHASPNKEADQAQVFASANNLLCNYLREALVGNCRTTLLLELDPAPAAMTGLSAALWGLRLS